MKIFKNIIAFVVVILIAAIALFAANGYIKYRSALGEVSLPEKIDDVKANEHYYTIDKIPDIYVKAVVAVEDRRYYYHNGFDIIGTVRALLADIKAGAMVEGGSTITQQLAKNLYFPQDNTLERKIAEVFMAFYIEKNLDKDGILELYFNCIYFGSGYYCIYDAAMGYFGKEPSEMNDYEATLLAGIPNAPSVYSPKVNPELAHNRQEKVVATMAECGYLTAEECDRILVMQKE